MRTLILIAALLAGGCATTGTPHNGRRQMPACSFVPVDGLACEVDASPEPTKGLSWLELQYVENNANSERNRICAIDPLACAKDTGQVATEDAFSAPRAIPRVPAKMAREVVKIAEAP